MTSTERSATTFLDASGNIGDPPGVIRDLQRSIGRRGLSPPRQLLAWRRFLGAQAGSRVYHAVQNGELSDEAMAHLAGLGPSASGQHAADAFRQSGPGERLGIQLANEHAVRNAAESVLDVQTAWGSSSRATRWPSRSPAT